MEIILQLGPVILIGAFREERSSLRESSPSLLALKWMGFMKRQSDASKVKSSIF